MTFISTAWTSRRSARSNIASSTSPPDGWKITSLGQQALQVAPAANAPSQAPRKEGRASDHERHYGKTSRDTSWFG